MKEKNYNILVLVLALLYILTLPIGVSATAQGTNGTEMQVAQPEKLEVHLGQEWAGIHFELKTDYGMYPGTIPVGEDGVLRLEIGGSTSYILTRTNAPVQGTTPAETTPVKETTEETESLVPIEDVTPTEATEPIQEGDTVSGIPITHIVMFGGGLLVAVSALIGISYFQKRRDHSGGDDDENDEF